MSDNNKTTEIWEFNIFGFPIFSNEKEATENSKKDQRNNKDIRTTK